MGKIKMCCITYREQDKLVEMALKELNDDEIEVHIVEGVLEEVIEKVEYEIVNGAEVLLAGGANAEVVREIFNIPLINFKISEFDILSAISEGIEKGKRPALVTYRNSMPLKLKEYLVRQKKDILNIVYEDAHELEKFIAESEADVIIGRAHAMEVGEKLGKITIPILYSISGMKDTIMEARHIVKEIRKVRQENQYKNIILNHTMNGVLLVDENGIIIDRNPIAKEILNLKYIHLKNQNIENIFPFFKLEEFKKGKEKEKSEVVKIEDEEILIQIIKMEENFQQYSGLIILLSKLNDILKAQVEYRKKKAVSEREKGFQAKSKFQDIIGQSVQLKKCIEDARVFAESDSSCLLYGETGVGKEIFAQSIHNESRRSDGPFIAINCGALPESLLEAELFGYDEGAFTGSKKGGKKGVFELADRGTLFLDEIGEISSLMQTRLLRVLQEHEIMRVGGERIIPVDVRVISATNKDLEHVASDEFRKDLLYRLNVLELHLPSLRQRQGDALYLFEHFYKQRRGREIAHIELPSEVQEILEIYQWPGNIREMQNVCERYCLYMEQTLTVNNTVMKRCMIRAIGEERLLQEIIKKYQCDGKNISVELVMALKTIMSYSREKIAQLLGTSRTTIWRLMKEKDVSKAGEKQN
ncbi:sigma 54-interacting transcriptional regulator [Mediterraneibacter sp. NSJ-55]|uniref:Sigma 54-interacting transcriptional regulator n=1 Tax=Mediterraneibacter hominis TaxID=2763054 RepID=A0A923LIY0_9FIRM|nr:sigma 54-interacting transcriptional regulator [Mediterraneibacter hominis]MBC5689605.1 sigma 54-interacting transcriptional regulator [Mediterraneibacter hominis]